MASSIREPPEAGILATAKAKLYFLFKTGSKANLYFLFKTGSRKVPDRYSTHSTQHNANLMGN